MPEDTTRKAASADLTDSEHENANLDSSFYYISSRAARELPLFQYNGEDRSLIYKYILSPLASFCVDHLTPLSLAPNTITLSGLVLMILAYCAMWCYAPTLESQKDPPRWVFLLNAIAILLYQTLDNMDGKQARRTGSSSPLGLLFDHGCDAVNSLFGSANWIVAMALNPLHDVSLCFVILFGPYALFYVGTWEEYHTGKLILPIVNGPNEGLIGGALMSLTSYMYGPTFWLQNNWWSEVLAPLLTPILPSFLLTILPESGLRNADLLVLASSVGFFQEISFKILHLVQLYGAHVLIRLLPFATLCVCTLAVGFMDLSVWLNSPRISLHLCATLFVEMTTDLMLSHMTKEPYKFFRWPLLPLVAFAIAICTGCLRSGDETETFLLAYSSAVFTYFCMKVTIQIHEICCLLNISCFNIAPSGRRQAINGHVKST
jgi:ethanolaminephosphotransferase